MIIVYTRESTCFIILYYYALYLNIYKGIMRFRKRFVQPLKKKVYAYRDEVKHNYLYTGTIIVLRKHFLLP